MKAMCISQPWASLVCAGLEDVLNRPWKPKENPGRMLIVALNVEVPQNYAELLPACWTYRIDNYIAMNQMPAIDSLPQKARTMVVLYYMEGYDVYEVAKLMGVTKGAVCAGLARAREKLRVYIEEDAQ